MGRKKRPESDDKEQFARFLEKAKEIQSETAKKDFEKAIDIIIKRKKSAKS